MPSSLILIVFSFEETSILISKSVFSSVEDLLDNLSNLRLSIASELFEINSLKNISLSEYKEFITIFKTRPVSASNGCLLIIKPHL